MEKYKFTLQNLSNNSITKIDGAEINKIIEILKGFTTKDVRNINKTKVSVKSNNSKNGFNPLQTVNDNKDISII